MGGESIEYNGSEAGYYRQIEQFIKAVETENQTHVRSSYTDAVKTLAVTLAANRSLATSQIETITV